MADSMPAVPVSLRRFLIFHLVASAAIAAAFGWEFGAGPRAAAAHLLLVAEWDVALLLAFGALAAAGPRADVAMPRSTFRILFATTCTLQVYLYALNIVSNESWDRNMTAHLVSAYAPTVWSGKEPLPVGPIGISVFAAGTALAIA